MKKHGSLSVHCPDATVNIVAGIMPLQQMASEGLKIAMGSDVAGGHGNCHIPSGGKGSTAVKTERILLSRLKVRPLQSHRLSISNQRKQEVCLERLDLLKRDMHLMLL